MNDTVYEGNETIQVNMQTPFVSGSGGGSQYYNFNKVAMSTTVDIIDDDLWKVRVLASDPIAQEKFDEAEQDNGFFLIERIIEDDELPGEVEDKFTGDKSYAVTVDFDILYSPSNAYYCPIPNVADFLASGQSPDYYLFGVTDNSNFQYVSYTRISIDGDNNEVSDEDEYLLHYSCTIPAEQSGVQIRVQSTFDWTDEGDKYSLGDEPGDQTGEHVQLTVVDSNWTGRGNWTSVGVDNVAEVDIKDGAVLQFFFDYDGDDLLDPFLSNLDETCFLKLNEDDLRILKPFCWIADTLGVDGGHYVASVLADFTDIAANTINIWSDENKTNAFEYINTTAGIPEVVQLFELSPSQPYSLFDFLYWEGITICSNIIQLAANVSYVNNENEATACPSLCYEIEAEVKTTANTINLSIDSDNSAGLYGSPAPENSENDAYEESLESAVYGLGKVIPPNTHDADNDGALDCWDGYGLSSWYAQMNPNSSAPFTPITVTIPEISLDSLEDLYVTFEYKTVMPIRPSNVSKKPKDPEGAIRIWTKDGSQVRYVSDDFITPNYSYSASSLGFTESNNTVTFYVEGIVENRYVGSSKSILKNPKPCNTIKVNLDKQNSAGNKETVSSNTVSYVIADIHSFYYHMSIPANQELRCAIASLLVYNTFNESGEGTSYEDNLNKFGLTENGARVNNTLQAYVRRIDRGEDNNQGANNGQVTDNGGFYADVYFDTSSQKNILAFRGTEFSSLQDWKTDLEQGCTWFGLHSIQYDKAMDIGCWINENNGTNVSIDDIVFTGHSLGGGLASACSLIAIPSTSLGVRTYTFNAATLLNSTVHNFFDVQPISREPIRENYRINSSSTRQEELIKAYVVSGEIVDIVQTLILGQRANGDIELLISLEPPISFFTSVLPQPWRIIVNSVVSLALSLNKHRMITVLDELEALYL